LNKIIIFLIIHIFLNHYLLLINIKSLILNNSVNSEFGDSFIKFKSFNTEKSLDFEDSKNDIVIVKQETLGKKSFFFNSIQISYA
jgi:hypothetical protein